MRDAGSRTVAAIAIIDETASCDSPDRPWPDVQPLAMRAPSRRMKPPAKATTRRIGNERNAHHPAPHLGHRRTASCPPCVTEMKAPMATPATSATCHQSLAVETWALKYGMSDDGGIEQAPSSDAATVTKDDDAPSAVFIRQKAGICSSPIRMPAA